MKIQTKLGIYFDVFDGTHDNNLIASYDTLEQAIEHAKRCVDYCVDIMLILEDPKTCSCLTETGDYIFSMRVYPSCKTYNNIDLNPVLVVEDNEDGNK